MDQTTVSGIIYDVAGNPLAGVNVYVYTSLKSGSVVSSTHKDVATSDEDGVVSFTVPRNSTVYLYGEFYIGSLSFLTTNGVPVTIPDSATVTLESLGAAVSGPTNGITVDGLNGYFNTINPGPGIVVTEESPGVLGLDTASSTESVQDTVAAMLPTALFAYDDALGTLPFATQAANKVFAGPATGSNAIPTWRSLVSADISDLSAVYQPTNAKLSAFAALPNGAGYLHNDGNGVFAYQDIDLSEYVPNTRTVNGHALSSNVTVTASDLGLAAVATSGSASDLSAGTLPAARMPALTGDITTSAGAVATSIGAGKVTFAMLATAAWSDDTSLAGNSATVLPTQHAVKTYADAGDASTLASAQAFASNLVVGLLDDRGNYDASVNTFPASGGSGSAGAILKGDLWTISVAGTLGGTAVTAGDVVRALTDTPGQTAGNWAIAENNFGYVALNQALASGKIYVGNVSGVGTAVTPSGDVTMTNAGVFAIASLPAISGANLTTLNASNISSGTLNAARLPATAALTGSSLAQFAATTSLELKTLISDETGSGALVFATSPTLVTPVLGVASATSLALGGLTSSFPSIKNNGAELNVLLADNSAFGNIRAANILANTGAGVYVNATATNSFSGAWGSGGITVGSGATFNFASAAGPGALVGDTSMSRNAAGVVQCGTSSANALGTIFAAKHQVATSVFWSSGAGSPEGAITANIGSLFSRTDGGANTTLYVKESGTGNTGWVAK